MMSSAAPMGMEEAKIFKSKKEINGTPGKQFFRHLTNRS